MARRKYKRRRSKKQDFKKYLPLAGIVVLLVLAWFLFGPNGEVEPTPIINPDPVACIEDAKECPDGSTVVRDPDNNCRFPDCPEVEEPINISFQINVKTL